jgi:hypothetical protein
MDLSIPEALRSLASAGAALKELAAWRRRAKGDARALIGELRDAMTYLDMVAEDGVALDEVIDKISTAEYARLAKGGYSFNALKRGRIARYASLEGTDLSSWAGKETEVLVESIYEKIRDLKIRYPHVADSSRYLWRIRVNNIRKRIWLLLRHVRG